MMPSVSDMNLFYILLAVICIPLMAGFLAEAGKDAYNKIRKKPDLSDFRMICKDCPRVTSLANEVEELKGQDTFMLTRQNTLREERIPTIESSVATIGIKIEGLEKKFDTFGGSMDKKIDKLFDLYDFQKGKKPP